MECRALSKSPGLHAVGAALNGAANRIPSRLAILYNVLLGIPSKYSFDKRSKNIFSKFL